MYQDIVNVKLACHGGCLLGNILSILLTHSRRDLLNVLNFEYLQLGDLPGIMSVKEFWKKTN